MDFNRPRVLLLVLVLLTVSATADNGQPVPFTELEQAKLTALVYEGAAMDADQRTLDLRKSIWQGKIAEFKAKAEAVRPGFTWAADTGKWTAVEVKK